MVSQQLAPFYSGLQRGVAMETKVLVMECVGKRDGVGGDFCLVDLNENS